MTAKQYDTISFGILVIFIGITAFLVTSGYLDTVTLLSILALIWPAFIIFAGLKILLESRTGKGYLGVFFDVFTYTLLIGVFLFGKSFLLPAYHNPPFEQEEQVVSSTQFPTVTSQTVSMAFGAAEVTVRDVNSPDILKVQGPQGYILQTADLNDVLSINITNERKRGFLRFANWGSPARYVIDLGGKQIPTTLFLNLGASNSNLLLDKTKLTELHSNVGAGESSITLGRTSLPESISLKVGAGKTVLTLIGTDAIKVDYSVGAGALSIYNAKTKEKKEFGGIGTNGSVETSALPIVTIDVNVGAGAVEIRIEP